MNVRNIKPIIPVLLILVGLGVGFFGGYQYRNYKLRKQTGNVSGNFQRFTGNRNGQSGQGMMFRGAVAGSILSIDNGSITIKLPDGSSKIVVLSGTTTYSNTVSATQSDLKTGDNVLVIGTTNSDGSVTATSVQLNPEFGKPQSSSPAPAQK